MHQPASYSTHDPSPAWQHDGGALDGHTQLSPTHTAPPELMHNAHPSAALGQASLTQATLSERMSSAPTKGKNKIRRATSAQTVADGPIRDVLEAASNYYLAACMTEGPLFPNQIMKNRTAQDKIHQTRARMRRMGKKPLLVPTDTTSLGKVMCLH